MATSCSDLEAHSYALVVHVWQLVRHQATIGGVPDEGSLSSQCASLFGAAYCLVARLLRVSNNGFKYMLEYCEKRLSKYGGGRV